MESPISRMQASWKDKPIEIGIQPLVDAFNSVPGVSTFSSCEGHYLSGKRPYVAFSSSTDFAANLQRALWEDLHSARPKLGTYWALDGWFNEQLHLLFCVYRKETHLLPWRNSKSCIREELSELSRLVSQAAGIEGGQTNMGLSTFLRQQRPLRVRGAEASPAVIGEKAMAQVADELRALGLDVYRVHADSIYFLADSLELAYRLHVAIVEASEKTGLWCFYGFFPACDGRFLGKEQAGRLAFVIEQPVGPVQVGDFQDALKNLLSCLQRLRQSPQGPWPFAASAGFPVDEAGDQ